MPLSEEIRGVILKALHDKWLEVGHVGVWATQILSSELSTASGIPLNDIAREAIYLGGCGLLQDLGGGRKIVATEEGIHYVQHPEDYPALASLIVISAGRDLTITNSQVASPGSFHGTIGSNAADIVAILGELRALVRVAGLDQTTQNQAAADIDALELQARRPQPNGSAMRALFQGLATTIQTAAALVQLDPNLPAKVEQLRALIALYFVGAP